MAEEQTNSRISELKARLEADPESRVFYQLGEELRKSKRQEEAEAVLRKGLEKHPGYLSALISLGRVLKETARAEEAIEVLNRAFELDRQNVVVARLLGEIYADTGEHVEAIKKYKLVAALHPADEEIQDRIQQLEQTLKLEGRFEEKAPPPGVPSPPVAAEQEEAESDEQIDELEPSGIAAPSESFEESLAAPEPSDEPAGSWGDTGSSSSDRYGDTAWSEPAASDEEQPVIAPSASGETDSDLGTESEQSPQGDGRLGAEEHEAEAGTDHDSKDIVATITMADLYARQGHVEEARSIYRDILDREPYHPEARQRLESLDSDRSDHEESSLSVDDSNQAKVQRLEEWLSKVRG